MMIFIFSQVPDSTRRMEPSTLLGGYWLLSQALRNGCTWSEPKVNLIHWPSGAVSFKLYVILDDPGPYVRFTVGRCHTSSELDNERLPRGYIHPIGVKMCCLCGRILCFWDTNLWYSRKNLVPPAVEAEWKSSLVRREGIIWVISLSDDAVYKILSFREVMNVLSRICKDYFLSAMTLINTVNVSHKMA